MKSSLHKTVARHKTPEWELEEFRRRAWLHDRIACIHVDRIKDDWARQVVINLANELYGRRW